MEYVQEIIKSILLEEANIGQVSDAIRQRKEVIITYDTDNEKGGGQRVIQPVAYGLSKAGNLVLRAFQPYGDTQTKVPHWKMFRLDKIKNWKTQWKKTFNEPPGQYNAEGEFNKSGDNSMSKVYLVANFERSKEFMNGERGQGLMRYNKQRQADALAKDPLYKFKRNIKNAQTDRDITNRVLNNPSSAAQEYVRGNDVYINDLNKVNNFPNTTQPQTSGYITKDSVENQNNTQTSTSAANYEESGPIYKKEE